MVTRSLVYLLLLDTDTADVPMMENIFSDKTQIDNLFFWSGLFNLFTFTVIIEIVGFMSAILFSPSSYVFFVPLVFAVF